MKLRHTFGAIALAILIFPVQSQAQETDAMTPEERRAHVQSLPEAERQALRDSKREENRVQRESMSDEERQVARDARRAESGTKREATRSRREAMTPEEREAHRDQRQGSPGAGSGREGRGQKGGGRQRNRTTT